MKKIYLSFIILLLLSNLELKSQIQIGNTDIDTTSIATGLDTPWEILWGPDDYIWFTERMGKVSRLNPETGEISLILDIQDKVHEQSEAGLLGMTHDPDFESNNLVYLVYNYLDNGNIKERLVRYSYEGDQLINEETLLGDIGGSGNHNGARIAFGPDGKLYLTTGDAVNTSLSQDLESLNGKVLRLNPDGSIPDDNPYTDSYIWSIGHRNPQGLVFGPTGILYSSEHGPSNDDEINIIEKGQNYGWPNVQGFCDGVSESTFCNTYNVVEPLMAWTPTLAVAGIDYYGNVAIPDWEHSILMTNLKASRLVMMKLSEDGTSIVDDEEYFNGWWGRLRDVCVSPDGRVFIASSNRDGRGSIRSGDDRIIELRAETATSTWNESTQSVIYPNPVSDGVLNLRNNWTSDQIIINIFDNSGRKLRGEKVNTTGNEIRIKMDYRPGIYFIEIVDGSRFERLRIIVY
ncbi:MAG: PQQ-dependent sugar dehydrogenase [Bacteroidales bacterium]